MRCKTLTDPAAPSWLRQRWCRAALAVALLLVFGAFSPASWQWSLIERKIRSEFPSVRRISTAELATWLSDRRRKPPLLLDVRTAAEFDVSHIAGARRVEPGASVADAKLTALAKDTPIVAYCSVGYRSSAFAKKLQEAGFTNVQNLEGSIFKWANESRPLVNANGRRADQAHPYNAFWGKLLKPEHRAL